MKMEKHSQHRSLYEKPHFELNEFSEMKINNELSHTILNVCREIKKKGIFFINVFSCQQFHFPSFHKFLNSKQIYIFICSQNHKK
jgi:hypothetical protein